MSVQRKYIPQYKPQRNQIAKLVAALDIVLEQPTAKEMHDEQSQSHGKSDIQECSDLCAEFLLRSKKMKKRLRVKSMLLRNLLKPKIISLEEKLVFIDNGISGNTLQSPALDELRDVIRFETIEHASHVCP